MVNRSGTRRGRRIERRTFITRLLRHLLEHPFRSRPFFLLIPCRSVGLVEKKPGIPKVIPSAARLSLQRPVAFRALLSKGSALSGSNIFFIYK